MIAGHITADSFTRVLHQVICESKHTPRPVSPVICVSFFKITAALIAADTQTCPLETGQHREGEVTPPSMFSNEGLSSPQVC